MCGIAGVLSNSQLTDSDINVVRKMNQSMEHRGPDDEGLFIDSHVALAMRRLSIIDLSGGHQPLFNEDKSATLVCNGEIYNFIELRKELESQGHRFSSHADTESLVHLYEEHGTSMFEKVCGMYGMALWDKKKQQLLIARDRFGEKPLYYYNDPQGKFWFASEMKSLLAGIGASRVSLSPQSAYMFLSYQYVPEPETMLSEVKKLPAATYATLSVGNLNVEPKVYWDYRFASPSEVPSEKHMFESVRNSLEDAVKIMLRSDVPVGVSLSGGIDSSLIAALTRKLTTSDLKAFSVGYPGRPDNDERQMAKSLADDLNIHFFDVELSDGFFAESFPRLIAAMDDPIGDIAAFGYYAVSQLAREKGIKVLLSGLGADELFWGYQWVREASQISLKRSQLKDRFGKLAFFFDPKYKEPSFFDKLPWVPDSAARTYTMLAPQAKELIASDYWKSTYSDADFNNIIPWLLDAHNKTWLASNCLALSDRTSMSHSVEVRLPFLDHRLSDMVTGWRRGGLNDLEKGHKWLLIKACEDILPKEIFNRPKRGFSPPVENWMKSVTQSYGHLLNDSILVRNGILKKNAEKMIPPKESSGHLYRLVLLEIWAKTFLEGYQINDLVPEQVIRGEAQL